jgi:hypothetical protein
MRWVLVNLDDGLFWGSGGWTPHRSLAMEFPNMATASQRAGDSEIKNAAAAMRDPVSDRLIGFVWLNEPEQKRIST